MPSFVCDICRRVYTEEDPKYRVRIEVFHAADELSIDEEELSKTDYSKKLQELLEEMKGRDPEELMDDVYRKFTYTLCRSCQRLYISDPLGGLR